MADQISVARTCPSCGRENRGQLLNCPFCGSPFAAAEPAVQSVPVDTAPQEVAGAPPADRMPVQGAVSYCPRCGTVNMPGTPCYCGYGSRSGKGVGIVGWTLVGIVLGLGVSMGLVLYYFPEDFLRSRFLTSAAVVGVVLGGGLGAGAGIVLRGRRRKY